MSRSGLVAMVVWVFLAACSSKKPGGGGDLPVECTDDEDLVGDTCVPRAWMDVKVDPVTAESIVADPDGTTYIEGTLWISFADGATSEATARALIEKHGGTLTGSVPVAGLYRGLFSVARSPETLAAKEMALASEPGVELVTRDLLMDAEAATRAEDTDLERVAVGSLYQPYSKPYMHEAEATQPVGIAERWAYGPGGANVLAAWSKIYSENPRTARSPVIVAVLDSEIEESTFPLVPFSHSLDVRTIYPTVGPPMGNPHGTMVASVIGASNDGNGMNGILSGLRCTPYDLAPVVVTADWGVAGMPGSRDRTFVGAVMLGMAYAIANGARVVNMSFRFAGLSRTLAGNPKALQSWGKLFRKLFARAPRVLFVIAAGNDNTPYYDYVPGVAASLDLDRFFPDSPRNFVVVGSYDRDLTKSSFSNWGDGVELSAPGRDVLMHLPNGNLTLAQGTSFAAPIVSGIAGLVLTISPGLSGAQVRALLLRTAKDNPSAPEFGKRVDAAAAVAAAIAGLPSEDKGSGSCVNEQLGPCPDGGCVWCIRGASMTVRPPSPHPSRMVTLAAPEKSSLRAFFTREGNPFVTGINAGYFEGGYFSAVNATISTDGTPAAGLTLVGNQVMGTASAGAGLSGSYSVTIPGAGDGGVEVSFSDVPLQTTTFNITINADRSATGTVTGSSSDGASFEVSFANAPYQASDILGGCP